MLPETVQVSKCCEPKKATADTALLPHGPFDGFQNLSEHQGIAPKFVQKLGNGLQDSRIFRNWYENNLAWFTAIDDVLMTVLTFSASSTFIAE